MITPNLIIGKDNYGHKLQCGDICSFKTLVCRDTEPKWEYMKGIILYDESSFSFAFITLDDFVPMILMSKVFDIEKLFEANIDNFNNIPDGKMWKEIYNSNAKL